MENLIYLLLITIIIFSIIYLINNKSIKENFFANCNNKINKYPINYPNPVPKPDINEDDNLNACNSLFGIPTSMPCKYTKECQMSPIGANEWENKAKEKPGLASDLTNLNNDCYFSSDGILSCVKPKNDDMTLSPTANNFNYLSEKNGLSNLLDKQIMFKNTYTYTNNAFPINSFDLQNKTKYKHGWTDNNTSAHPKPNIIGIDGVKFTYN